MNIGLLSLISKMFTVTVVEPVRVGDPLSWAYITIVRDETRSLSTQLVIFIAPEVGLT